MPIFDVNILIYHQHKTGQVDLMSTWPNVFGVISLFYSLAVEIQPKAVQPEQLK